MSIRRIALLILAAALVAQAALASGPYQITGTSGRGTTASCAPSTPSRREPTRSTVSR